MEDKQSFLDLVNELYTENRESSLSKLIKLFKNQTELINLLIGNELNDGDELKRDEFLKSLINLPQITANLFQLLNDQLFTPVNYFNILCSIINESLKIVQ